MLRYLSTILIALFIMLVEALWFFISVRYGFIEDGDIASHIPWAVIALFIPFLIGLIVLGIPALFLSHSFRKKRFHTRVNWIALVVALMALVVIVTKKVPVQKALENDGIMNNEKSVLVEKPASVDKIILSMQEQKKVVLPQAEVLDVSPQVAVTAKVSDTLPTASDVLFKEMKNSCFKSHSPDDGFNQVQMLSYCECVVDDAKLNLSTAEIKSIIKSLATKDTSGEALLENDAMVGIVVECITKVSSQIPS